MFLWLLSLIILLLAILIVTKVRIVDSNWLASKLLDYLMETATTPRLLAGTWADASWAIRFYEKHGFVLLPDKDELLKKYWDIPKRQIETSVVLGMGAG